MLPSWWRSPIIIPTKQINLAIKNSPDGLNLVVIAGATDRIRTCDLRIRSPLLYPAELRLQNQSQKN